MEAPSAERNNKIERLRLEIVVLHEVSIFLLDPIVREKVERDLPAIERDIVVRHRWTELSSIEQRDV
jgi:hypothetical protein